MYLLSLSYGPLLNAFLHEASQVSAFDSCPSDSDVTLDVTMLSMPQCLPCNNWIFESHKIIDSLIFMHFTAFSFFFFFTMRMNLFYKQQQKNQQMSYLKPLNKILGFPGVSTVKNPLANVGDAALVPGSGRAPREDGNLL